MSRDITIKEEIAPPSPLTGDSPESSKTSKADKKDKKKDKSSSHDHAKSSSRLKRGSSGHSDDYEAYKGDEWPKRVTVFKPVIRYFTAALDFENCHLQKQS